MKAGGQGRTILIVEDSENMLALLSRRFVQWGFRVLSASEGEAALEVYQQHRRELDIVLLDIGLPKVSGEQLVLKMRKENPELAVVVASGYIDPVLKSNLLELGVKAFISKPYDLRQLQSIVNAALERPTAV
jgi:DNA-binding response OmpR family regulator